MSSQSGAVTDRSVMNVPYRFLCGLKSLFLWHKRPRGANSCAGADLLQSCQTRSAAPQAPLSVGLSRQEYWSESPFPPPRDLPDPGLNLHFLHLLP